MGQPRASACLEPLSELNPYVATSVLAEGALSEAIVCRFSVVVFTGLPRSELLRWNAACRAAQPPVVFLAADVRGAAARAFADFGPEWVTRDANGEATRSAIVASISREESALVVTHDAKRHGFDEGDHVVFRELEGGMGALLNAGAPARISSVTPFSFRLERDTRGAPDFSPGAGVVEQAKVPRPIAHGSLEERLLAPVHPGEGSML